MAPVADPKSKRYDRQLRIWGTHGQQRLESCCICLLNCGPTGSETLKNLVLGGIASFTIVDGGKVEARDLGNNFLVSASSLGEPRAKVVTELLQELNESVSGSYVEEVPEVLIADNPAFFSGFDLVIATQMREQDAVALDAICRATGRARLLLVRSYGLVGYLRASLPEHRIVESKPDSQLDDLRLNAPWPELSAFAASFPLEQLDEVAHAHVPYVVLLLQAAERWRGSHGGALPASGADKSAFKAAVGSMRRTADGVPLPSENFDEALKAAFHVWTPYSIPSEVRALLADDAASLGGGGGGGGGSGLGPGSDDFWILVAALQAFVEAEGGGCLPLEGSIPDMHATTDLYLRLAAVYRDKAERDTAAVAGHVRRLLAAAGRPADSIPADTIKSYCRHARHLRCVRYRTLAEETAPDTARGGALAAALAAGGGGFLGPTDAPPGSSDAALYVLLRAADRFFAQTGRYPGDGAGDPADDVPLLRQAAQQVGGGREGGGRGRRVAVAVAVAVAGQGRAGQGGAGQDGSTAACGLRLRRRDEASVRARSHARSFHSSNGPMPTASAAATSPSHHVCAPRCTAPPPQVLIDTGVVPGGAGGGSASGGGFNPRKSPDSSSGSGAAAAAAVSEDLIAEFCRFGAAELHVIAAFMGGVGAQEAIKLVTRQFVPLAGSLLYNAMAATTTVLEL
ncbi:hypothetical protein HXX76_014782 [Chlamydomonas incerta]|uniref:NEDD8-activating enzyme E1 regulatory subunit n=1 Tax=Chlamydomonas incerta TaxID=51695 RepID=A0A835VSE5_CHLIN|nr:hypothetical protein HXX76_014782 [Chlamydomonas incerta]|eukprot:KAG2424108.1 hypothetical protein HXX76_014782 [Chlamydomonas incerta]